MLISDALAERAKIANEVANLQDDISTKERLLFELEQSERRLAQVRRDYERKVHELSERISSTEAERDKILVDISKRADNHESEEKIRAVRAEYEKRLNGMRGDLTKMKTMKSEQERARQRQVAQQQELERKRRELEEMKRAKVKLTQQMREEGRRVKKAELDAARKVSTLEKDARYAGALVAL